MARHGRSDMRRISSLSFGAADSGRLNTAIRNANGTRLSIKLEKDFNIAVLIGGAAGLSHITVYVAIGAVMTLGGLLFVRRIAEVMSQKITKMNASEGLTGNLVTAFLVIVASKMGLAVSTTHVSVGALFGIGAENGQANLKKIIEIVLSWVMTLPIAFGLAFTIAKLLSVFS